MRIGGALGFFQTDDGTVFISIEYPYIRVPDIDAKQQGKPIANTVEPSAIQEKDIIEHVETFVQSLIEYASHNEHRITQLGFDTPRE